MEMTAVDSSVIAAIGYDRSSQTLQVQFRKSGGIYTYTNFPEELHGQFMSAESKGKFFGVHIRKLSGSKVEQKGEAQ
jgi:hypothetical protein